MSISHTSDNIFFPQFSVFSCPNCRVHCLMSWIHYPFLVVSVLFPLPPVIPYAIVFAITGVAKGGTRGHAPPPPRWSESKKKRKFEIESNTIPQWMSCAKMPFSYTNFLKSPYRKWGRPLPALGRFAPSFAPPPPVLKNPGYASVCHVASSILLRVKLLAPVSFSRLRWLPFKGSRSHLQISLNITKLCNYSHDDVYKIL